MQNKSEEAQVEKAAVKAVRSYLVEWRQGKHG